MLWLIESFRVLRTSLLYRLYAGVVLHWVHLLVEVLRAEVAEVREREYGLSLLGFFGGDLYDLFLLDDLDLCLEEALSSDHLCVLDYHRLHLGRRLLLLYGIVKISVEVDVLVSLGRQDVHLVEVLGGRHIHLLGVRRQHVSRRHRLRWSELDRSLARDMDHLLLLS